MMHLKIFPAIHLVSHPINARWHLCQCGLLGLMKENGFEGSEEKKSLHGAGCRWLSTPLVSHGPLQLMMRSNPTVG